MDEHQLGPDYHVEIGRIIAVVYLGASAATLLLFLVGGIPIDRWALLTFAVGPVGALVTTRLPWAEAGPTLTRLSLIAGVVVTMALSPVLVRDPALLALPVLSAALCGLSLPGPWLVAYNLPVASALGIALARATGDLRGAITTTAYLSLIGLGVGTMGLWQQSRIARADAEAEQARAAERARVDEQAAQREAAAQLAVEESDRRAALGRSLRGKVEQVASGSQEIDRQSDRITAAIEELAVSLRETAVASEQAASSAEEIASAAERGDTQVAELGRAGQEIVGIVDTITELSEQTNLLALNATIEAARAGDAGKGFAVVANEVKDLANLTAKSAANIAQVVDHVQKRVTDSSAAMSTITEMVGGLDQAQTMLNALVRSQSETVEQISEAVISEAAGIAAITRAIEEIDREAGDLSEERPPAQPAGLART